VTICYQATESATGERATPLASHRSV
jgi:hypothetical protein